jgi:hypothetical protein
LVPAGAKTRLTDIPLRLALFLVDRLALVGLGSATESDLLSIMTHFSIMGLRVKKWIEKIELLAQNVAPSRPTDQQLPLQIVVCNEK